MNEYPVMIRLTPTEKEWANRALRAVLEYDPYNGYDDHATRLFQLISGQYRGFTLPMTSEAAAKLARLIYSGRRGGGPNWEKQVVKVADKFITDQHPAVLSKTTEEWIPASRSKRPGKREEQEQ